MRPRRVAPTRPDAPVSTLPQRDGGGHGEQRLDHRPKGQPQARFGSRAHVVAYTTEAGTEDEGEERGEGLLICEVEGGVVRGGGRREFEETAEGEGELDRVTGLKTTPDEDGGEGDGVTGSMHGRS